MTSDLIVVLAGSAGAVGTLFAVVRDWVASRTNAAKMNSEIRIEVDGKNFTVNATELNDAQVEKLIKGIIENRRRTGNPNPGSPGDHSG